MKKGKILHVIAAGIFGAIMISGFDSCKIDDLVDPNNPSLEGVVTDATVDELNNLVSGMEAGMRTRLETYIDDCGVIGREYYRFSGADPRFTSDLLGKGSATLDNNTFYLVNPWANRYKVVRTGWILLSAVENTSASISAAERNGYNGYAKTIMAYQMLLNANMTYINPQGCIRVDTEDPDNMGPLENYNNSLAAIRALLDDGASDLSGAGDAFLFSLSSGFAGFETPATFRQFNRALAARVAVYQEDWNQALTDLTESFLSLGGGMSTGVYHIYSNSAGDELNQLYYAANSSPGGNARCAHNSFVDDAIPTDTRLNKVGLRTETAFQDDLSSDYDVLIYLSNVDPVCIIRNEELVLIYAEANAQLGNSGDAVNGINAVRDAAGIGAYAGGVLTDALINEILFQRRYSLFAEGHRWVDMRRYNKLGELPIDRDGDDVWQYFPIPADETLN